MVLWLFTCLSGLLVLKYISYIIVRVGHYLNTFEYIGNVLLNACYIFKYKS